MGVEAFDSMDCTNSGSCWFQALLGDSAISFPGVLEAKGLSLGWELSLRCRFPGVLSPEPHTFPKP